MPTAADSRTQVVLADARRRLGIANIESVRLRPASGVTTNSLCIENLLRRRHHLVGRVTTGIRGVGVAACLNSLYFCQLLRRQLFRCENVIDLFVARVCYVRQATSQIVDSIGSRIKRRRFCLILFGKIQMELLPLLESGYEIVCRMPLIICSEGRPLRPQVLRIQLLLRALLAPVLSAGA
nr:hypothetical protein [Mycobacterium colombiense]